MLLNQGAAAFELWTGQQPPMDLLRERLDEARKEVDSSARGEPTKVEPPDAEPPDSEPGDAAPTGAGPPEAEPAVAGADRASG